MSDLKVDGIIASTGTNTNLTLQGKGTGKVAIGDGALLFPDADGSANQVIETNASGVLSFVSLPSTGFTLATEQATTSGTSVTFGSIPTGTKLIIIMFEDVSMNSGADFDVTIGDSGGLETSGYVSSSARMEATAFDMNNSTADFMMKLTDASTIVSGLFTLALKDASNFTWVASYICKSLTNKMSLGGGHKSLSAELTQVAISGGTFDNGSINIMYQ
jgi:hypothetical protein